MPPLRGGIRWLFFDMGGTLLDETAATARWCADWSVASGGVLSPAEIEETYRQGRADYGRGGTATAAIIKRLQALGARVPTASQVAYSHDRDRLYPVAPSVLEALAQHYQLGVIANQAPGSAQRLERLGIRHFFKVVVASAEAGVSKPDPRIFEMALEEAGCLPAQAVMIGDRLDNDIYPARRLGFATIRLRQGAAAAQEPLSIAYEPDLTLAGLDELVAALL